MVEELQDNKDLSPEIFIPEELTPVIKDLPKEKQDEIKAIFSISIKKKSSVFRGPLPHPLIPKSRKRLYQKSFLAMKNMTLQFKTLHPKGETNEMP